MIQTKIEKKMKDQTINYYIGGLTKFKKVIQSWIDNNELINAQLKKLGVK